MTRVRLWLVLAVVLSCGAVGWGFQLQGQTGFVPDSLRFIDSDGNPLTAPVLFTRDVEDILLQFSFINAELTGRDVPIAVNAQAALVVSGAAQSPQTVAIECELWDEDNQVILNASGTATRDCAALEIPGAEDRQRQTTVRVRIPDTETSNLPGQSTQRSTIQFVVLVTLSDTSQQDAVTATGGEPFLQFTLEPSPPSVSIEGPITIDPELPRQGDLVTVSFILANNKSSVASYFLTVELSRFRRAQREDFIDTEFLRIDASSCVNCNLQGSLAGNERRRAEFKFLTTSMQPSFLPTDVTDVSVSAQSATDGDGTADAGAGQADTISGTVESVTEFEGDVFVLLTRDVDGAQLWLRILGPVTNTGTEPDTTINPQDIRVGMRLDATIVATPAVQAAPVASTSPAEQLYEPYLLRITVNPQETNTSNQIIVSFNLREPVRHLVLGAPQSVPTQAAGDTLSFGVSVFNDSSLFLGDNYLEVALNRIAEGTTQLIPLESDRCRIEPTSGSLVGVVGPCTRLAFDLTPRETMTFRVTLDTTGLQDGLYQFDLRVGPEGVGQSTAATLGLQNRGTVEFRLAPDRAPEPGGLPAATRGPELRPVELQIVPSATVQRGKTLILSSVVRNSGNLAAEQIEVVFSLRGDGEDTAAQSFEFVQYFPRLGIGRSLEARQAFETQNLPPGRYRAQVLVRHLDPDAAELDPSNNVLEAIINIVAAPDEQG